MKIKWYNKDKTIMVAIEAVEFYKFFETTPPFIQISMYGNNKILVGEDAYDLYTALLDEIPDSIRAQKESICMK